MDGTELEPRVCEASEVQYAGRILAFSVISVSEVHATNHIESHQPWTQKAKRPKMSRVMLDDKAMHVLLSNCSLLSSNLTSNAQRESSDDTQEPSWCCG